MRGGHQAAAQALTRRLVLETRQFTALLGALQPDGRLRVRKRALCALATATATLTQPNLHFKKKTTQAGPLQAFAPLLELTNVTAFRDTIIAEAADAADRAGRLDDALLLYNLAQVHAPPRLTQGTSPRRCALKLGFGTVSMPQRYNDVLQVLGRRLADRLFHLTEREKNELRR